MTLAEFRARFRTIHRVNCTESVTQEQEDLAIREALTHHSLKLPKRETALVTVSGWAADLQQIPHWCDRCRVERVKYRGRTVPPAAWFAEGDTLEVGVSGQVRVEYIRPHRLDNCGTTLRSDEIEPVCHLATHFLLAQLSNEYVKTMQSSINADAVNFSSQNVSYFTKSQDEMRRYNVYLESRYQPGSARVDYSTTSQTGLRPIFRGDI